MQADVFKQQGTRGTRVKRDARDAATLKLSPQSSKAHPVTASSRPMSPKASSVPVTSLASKPLQTPATAQPLSPQTLQTPVVRAAGRGIKRKSSCLIPLGNQERWKEYGNLLNAEALCRMRWRLEKHGYRGMSETAQQLAEKQDKFCMNILQGTIRDCYEQAQRPRDWHISPQMRAELRENAKAARLDRECKQLEAKLAICETRCLQIQRVGEALRNCRALQEGRTPRWQQESRLLHDGSIDASKERDALAEEVETMLGLYCSSPVRPLHQL